AAYLLRYGKQSRVDEHFRDVGEIRWLLFWPDRPFWPDSAEAGEALLAACLAQLERWGVSRQVADGALPAPFVYGIPPQWAHGRAALARSGFRHEGRVEIVFLADVTNIAQPAPAPIDGVTLRRTLGINGTRFSAVLDGEAIAYIEVETLERNERQPRGGGWA